MKKRLLSIVCVVALVVTMLSASLIHGFADAQTGTFTHFDGMNANDWTATKEADMGLIKDNGTIDFVGAGSNNEHEFTHKTAFNSDEYFEFTGNYNNTAQDGYMSIAVGDLKIMYTLDKNANGLVDISNDAKLYIVVKMGDTTIHQVDAANWATSTSQWIISKTDHVKFTYDNGKLTACFVRNDDDGTPKPIFTNLDLTTLNGWDADYTTKNQTVKIGAYNNWQSGVILSKLSLVGKTVEGGNEGGNEGGETGKEALVGTGLQFNATVPPVAGDWTFSCPEFIDGNGKTLGSYVKDATLLLGAGNTNEVITATYKDTFNLTEGFTLTYTATGSATKNYSKGTPYLGATVGNITAGVELADYNGGTANSIVLVIYVDGEKVATSDPIFYEGHPNWVAKDSNEVKANIEIYFGSSYEAHSDTATQPVYTLAYDPAAKTITYTKTLNDGTVAGTVTYTDSADAIAVEDAKFELVSRRSYNVNSTYKNLKLVGAPQQEGETPEEIVKGEKLTQAWTPETLEEADWTGHTERIEDGEFVIAEGNSTYTIWTVKSYDLSEGFKFKGTLAMKNSYANYYNEWCAAYFGNEDVNLELRIRNDDTTPGDADKDNTYTAYLLYNGKELASYDLLVLPNGEYELTYKDGKVSVSLGGVAISWTLADGSQSTAVAVDGIDLNNAKLGLRLSGNYARYVRKWTGVSLAPLSATGGDGVKTGDARNLVIPAVVMLVSALAAATLFFKKIRA